MSDHVDDDGATDAPNYHPDIPPVLSPLALAELLGIARSTLDGWRRNGEGPAFVRLGGGRNAAVRYRREAVLEWLVSREEGGPRHV